MRGPAPRFTRFRYCTLALTEASAVIVNVHVFRLLPPLEHAPDQIASRPLDTDSVICVPAVKQGDRAPSERASRRRGGTARLAKEDLQAG